MAYIRHRTRMVQESVFEDLKNTLIAARWMAGTTTREVMNPSNANNWEIVTTAPEDVYPLVQGNPINLLDYFPDFSGATPLNTFAVDVPSPGEIEDLEVGSSAVIQPYLFNYAFYASSAAVATAVFSDLLDRYQGRLINLERIALYDYNSASTDPATYMEINLFRFTRDLQQAAPYEVNLFFAELEIEDIVDP